MISPEIWESQNFSALSDLAKIVFISLFSHADDEGRGKAEPAFIKNTTFPYDENRRVADIKQALSEIALRMSVQFYSVNGIEYYFMKSWERWQKIDKPSQSKLPPPPTVGVGGDIHSNEKFDEHSTNPRGIIGESSPTNIIEDNIKEKNIKEVSKKEDITAHARESYDDILDGCGVTGDYRNAFIEFIRHCILNKSTPTNDKIYDIIVRLDLAYQKDDELKAQSLRKAVRGGYFDIRENK
ncbi:MAG: hypothetical protein [Caudoviricetes sp.]|nr:MAG: hypothetical protein [Caudoviricetes sp.]